GRVAEFCAELILDNSEFSDRVIGNARDPTRRILTIVIDSFNIEAVVAWSLAADSRAYPYADSARTRDTSAQQRQIKYPGTAAGRVCGHRKVCRELARINGRNLRSRRIDLRRGLGHIDARS